MTGEGREAEMRGDRGAVDLSHVPAREFLTFPARAPANLAGALRRRKTRRKSTWEMRASVQEAVVRVLSGRTPAGALCVRYHLRSPRCAHTARLSCSARSSSADGRGSQSTESLGGLSTVTKGASSTAWEYNPATQPRGPEIGVKRGPCACCRGAAGD